MKTKKDFLIQFYEKWLERLTAAEVDIETYKDEDENKVIATEEIPSGLSLGKQGIFLTKKEVRVKDILDEAKEKREIAQKFCDAILSLIQEEEKKEKNLKTGERP